MEVPPLSDDESLVRAFFCPEHHDGKAFLATAVSLDDLKDRGFSVDRPTLTPLSVLTHRVDNQRAKNPEQREFPKYSQLFYSKLKEDRNAEGQHYFEVQPSPLLESGDMRGNPGHASIYSADKKLGNGGLRKVRAALIEHLNNVVELKHIPYIRDEAPE